MEEQIIGSLKEQKAGVTALGASRPLPRVLAKVALPK
jgi:hypothetical protein